MDNPRIIDLRKWTEKGTHMWQLEYDCPVCPRSFHAEVYIGMYAAGMEEVPLFGELSSGLFLIRQATAFIAYPPDADGEDAISQTKSVVSQNLGQLIFSHLVEEPEVHASFFPPGSSHGHNHS